MKFSSTRFDRSGFSVGYQKIVILNKVDISVNEKHQIRDKANVFFFFVRIYRPLDGSGISHM